MDEYTIKEFDWKKDHHGGFEADTGIFKYWAWTKAGISFWSYSGSSQINMGQCKTIKEAQAAAYAHWLSKIEKCLNKKEKE